MEHHENRNEQHNDGFSIPHDFPSPGPNMNTVQPYNQPGYETTENIITPAPPPLVNKKIQ